jgi:hypothetical protein
VGDLIARSMACIDDQFSGRRLWNPLQAVGRVGVASPRVGVAFFYCARAKVLAAVARPFAWRNVTTAMATAHACKLEAWPTCLLQTAKPRNYKESSTLAWAWH